mmetsp:Transcript_9355/g.27252  ORF Transcript_9355/g.27252 Transcript_9355/m.27252 type:complete len:269 (+) Transcript_9355:21-827(+)
MLLDDITHDMIGGAAGPHCKPCRYYLGTFCACPAQASPQASPPPRSSGVCPSETSHPLGLHSLDPRLAVDAVHVDAHVLLNLALAQRHLALAAILHRQVGGCYPLEQRAAVHIPRAEQHELGLADVAHERLDDGVERVVPGGRVEHEDARRAVRVVLVCKVDDALDELDELEAELLPAEALGVEYDCGLRALLGRRHVPRVFGVPDVVPEAVVRVHAAALEARHVEAAGKLPVGDVTLAIRQMDGVRVVVLEDVEVFVGLEEDSVHAL